MTDDISRLEQEIAELRQALERVAGIPSVAAMLRAQIDEKQRQLAARKGAASASQAPGSSGPSVTSVQSEAAYIATHQTIQNFFGGAPPEDGARLLDDYLAALCDALAPLRLSRMTEKRRSGAGQSLIPMLQLADVFTNLTLAGEPVVLKSGQVRVAQAKPLVAKWQNIWQKRSADTMPPEDVRILRVRPVEAPGRRLPRIHGEATELADLPDDLPVDIALCRPRLALEALAVQPRTVLLGAPGSGKSTVLVYLTLLLAHHLRHPERYPLPFGWQRAPVPLLCPLGRVANALAQPPAGQSDAETLWKLLEQHLDGDGVRPGLGRHLRPALRRGAVALLFDGLDEISARPGANGISLRARVSRAVQAMARELPRTALVAVTCRVLPYEQAGDAGSARSRAPGDDWRLPADDGWVVERIQPLAFGQVRQFVGNWYAAAARAADAIYTPEEAAQRAGSLLEQLAYSARLHELGAVAAAADDAGVAALQQGDRRIAARPGAAVRRVRRVAAGALGAGAPAGDGYAGLAGATGDRRPRQRAGSARGDAPGGAPGARSPAASGRWARAAARQRTGRRDEPLPAAVAVRPDRGTPGSLRTGVAGRNRPPAGNGRRYLRLPAPLLPGVSRGVRAGGRPRDGAPRLRLLAQCRRRSLA